jgi:2-(1,2-epoxy-1,2-dihydrophenyl)acetyl-CoA isomerase
MESEKFKEIIYDLDQTTGIVTVTLNRPEIKNALTFGLLRELHLAACALEEDAAAKAMIITGVRAPEADDPTGEAFSSGGYFNPSEVAAMDPDVQKEIDFTDIAQKKLCLKMWQLEKPVIAAINGLAIGGGFTVPLACADLIYVSEHAWVKLPFVTLGIVPELASSYLLPRLLGMQRAKEIMFFGEPIDAQRLLELGLVNKVLPHEQLLPYARKMAGRLIEPQGAGLAVKMTKQALHKPLMDSVAAALDLENEALNRAVQTEDFFEALTARKEKRPPVFKGR